MEKEWSDVEQFVSELRGALDTEAKTIRETELDQVGEYREAELRMRENVNLQTPDPDFAGMGDLVHIEQVFVDKLGRVILPSKPQYERLVSVTFSEGHNGSEVRTESRGVNNIEPRYRGQKIVAYVVYLEDAE